LIFNTYQTFRIITSKRIKWLGHVARMGRGEAHTGFRWSEPEGNGPLGRPRARWDDNINMDIQVVEWDSMDWIYLA